MLCDEVDGLVRRANVAGACETLKGRLPTGLQDAILPHEETHIYEYCRVFWAQPTRFASESWRVV